MQYLSFCIWFISLSITPIAAAAAKSPSVVSDSVRPQRWQPTRLFCPWDSPGKNTRVGCHFLLQGVRVKSESEVAQSCPTSLSHGLQPTRLLHPWDFPSKNTGVGCQCLLRARMARGALCKQCISTHPPIFFTRFLQASPRRNVCRMRVRYSA